MSKIVQERYEKLYLAGMSDGEIAKEFKVTKTTVYKHREKLEWPPNSSLFTWQKSLKPSEYLKIPERYRKQTC